MSWTYISPNRKLWAELTERYTYLTTCCTTREWIIYAEKKCFNVCIRSTKCKRHCTWPKTRGGNGLGTRLWTELSAGKLTHNLVMTPMVAHRVSHGVKLILLKLYVVTPPLLIRTHAQLQPWLAWLVCLGAVSWPNFHCSVTSHTVVAPCPTKNNTLQGYN